MMTTKMVIRPLDPRLAAANKRLLANIEAFVEDDHPLLSDTRTLLLLTQNLFWHLRCSTSNDAVVQATLVEEEVHFCRGSDGAPLYALSTATPHKHGVTGRSLVVVVGVEEAEDDHPPPLAQTINNNNTKKEWVIRGGREWIEMRDEMLVALGGWPMYVRTRGLERNRELRGEGVAYYDSFEWPPAMAQHIQIEEDQTRAGLFCEPPLLLPAPAAPQAPQQLHRIVDYVYHRLNAETPQLSLESMAQFLMWKGPLFTSTWTEATTTLRFTHPYWVGGAYHLSTLPTEAHKLLLQLLTSPEPPNAQWIYGWEHDDRGQLDVFQSPEEWAMRCDELWDLKK